MYLKIDKVLVQKAAFGPKNPKEFDIKNPIILNINEGICRAVASSGKSELISDTSIDSRYRVDDDPRFSEINAKTYIEEFVHELSRSYNTFNKIVLKCDLEELFYDLELSVPFGLILNELITNALKHAFPENAGTVFISLKRSNNQVILNVSDNGVGSNPDIKDKTTLGFELIETLTQQLNGTFCIDTSSKGTSCSLSFFM